MKIKKIIYKNYIIIRVLIDKIINEYYINYENFKTTNRIFKKNTFLSNLYNAYQDPTYIIHNIYIGNSANARNFYKLKDMNIGLIVNCTVEIPSYFKKDFKYINVNITDTNDVNIYPYLDKTVDKIHTFLNNNKKNSNILVHCFAGASRSVSIVIAYLIKYHNHSFDTALTLCKNKRYIVNVNIDFCYQLIKYEKYIRNKYH